MINHFQGAETSESGIDMEESSLYTDENIDEVLGVDDDDDYPQERSEDEHNYVEVTRSEIEFSRMHNDSGFVEYKNKEDTMKIRNGFTGYDDSGEEHRVKEDEIMRMQIQKQKDQELMRIQLQKEEESMRILLQKQKEEELMRIQLQKQKEEESIRIQLQKQKEEELMRIQLQKQKEDELMRMKMQKDEELRAQLENERLLKEKEAELFRTKNTKEDLKMQEAVTRFDELISDVKITEESGKKQVLNKVEKLVDIASASLKQPNIVPVPLYENITVASQVSCHRRETYFYNNNNTNNKNKNNSVFD